MARLTSNTPAGGRTDDQFSRYSYGKNLAHLLIVSITDMRVLKYGNRLGNIVSEASSINIRR